MQLVEHAVGALVALSSQVKMSALISPGMFAYSFPRWKFHIPTPIHDILPESNEG